MVPFLHTLPALVLRQGFPTAHQKKRVGFSLQTQQPSLTQTGLLGNLSTGEKFFRSSDVEDRGGIPPPPPQEMGKPRFGRAGQKQPQPLGSLSHPAGLPQTADGERYPNRAPLKSQRNQHILAGKGQAAHATHQHHIFHQEGGKSMTFISQQRPNAPAGWAGERIASALTRRTKLVSAGLAQIHSFLLRCYSLGSSLPVLTEGRQKRTPLFSPEDTVLSFTLKS